MSQRSKEEIKPRPWEQGLEGEGESFGGWLRRQREMRDIDLRAISDTSKVNLRYLEALEENRFSALPAPVFAKGFLREYAKYVGLDPDEVVNYYITAQQEAEPQKASTRLPSRLHSSTHWAYGLVLTLAVVVLFGIVALLSFYAERRAPDEEDVPPMAAPVFVKPEVPAEEPSVEEQGPPLRVTLDFTQNCWVEAIVDGRDRISELRVQGESLRLEARERVVLTLGNTDGVRIEVNDRPLEIAADTGNVLHDLEITLDSIGSETDSVEPLGPNS